MIRDNALLWLLLCGHWLGDFYGQSQSLADQKKEALGPVFRHSLLYALFLLLALSPVLNGGAAVVLLLCGLAHLAIDLGKALLFHPEWVKAGWAKNGIRSLGQKGKTWKINLFLLDQGLHIATIVLIAYFYAINNSVAANGFGQALLRFYQNCQIPFSPLVCLRLCCIFLFIGKPANLLIQAINRKERIQNQTAAESAQDPDYEHAGRIIGTLERVLMVVLLLMGQYVAIGFVFTAKSITRYNKIAEVPAFAEYYLIGTLLSLLLSLGAVLVIQPL